MLHWGEFSGTVEQVLTLVVKLQVGSEQQQLLFDTCSAFASACNWINENVNPRLTNRNSIQAVCYQDVKNRFGLTANHVVRACGRVAANRLTAKQKGKKVKNFASTSFDCDARTFRFVEKDWVITVSTTGKRLTLPLRASNYHRGKLTGQNPTSAQICLHRDGGWYVHIQLKSEPPKPINADNIGIRSGKLFKCSNKTCGWIGDADANGSQMIKLLGLSVIQPGDPNLLACPISSGLQKAPVKLTL